MRQLAIDLEAVFIVCLLIRWAIVNVPYNSHKRPDSTTMFASTTQVWNSLNSIFSRIDV